VGDASLQICGKCSALLTDLQYVFNQERANSYQLFSAYTSALQFYHLSNPQDYTDLVCTRDYRPAIDESLPQRLQTVISQSWDPDYGKRPSFKRIAIQLGVELRDLTADHDQLNRSERMIDKSARSFKANARNRHTH